MFSIRSATRLQRVARPVPAAAVGPDPFDPRFAAAADKMARNAAVWFRGDPYLIGYFVAKRGSVSARSNHKALRSAKM